MVLTAAHYAPGVEISITADAGNSSTAYNGSAVGNLLTDPFAYDSVNPAATSPVRNWTNGSNAFHGGEANNVDVILSFVLNTPYTQSDTSLFPVIDLWGRNDCCQIRDDDVDVILYNGDYSTVVAMVTGIKIPDAAPQHVRALFNNLGIGETFDRFRIIGHDSDPAAGNPFTLFELRLALAIPYTYLWTGEAGDGNWTNAVNWLAGMVPVDNRPGTGDDAGLTLLRSKSIAFGGDHLPATNFPGIGGNTGSGDSPTMIFKSGGPALFHVVSREAGIWTDSRSGYSTILTVGDGIGGGTEDVTLTLTNLTGTLNRHTDGTHNFTVNSDGTLIFSENVDFSYNAARFTTMTINDGAVIVRGYVNDLDNLANNFVEFTSTGGTFTARYGSDYPALYNVKTRLGIDFVSGPDYPNFHLRAIDNGNSTFTVTPGVTCWTGEANDGDWNNAANWAYGRIPVDNAPGTGNLDGLTVPYNEFIVFDGTNMPTQNVPQFGGDLSGDKDTPTLRFKRGGAFTMSVTGRDDGFWSNTRLNRTVLTVGDGISGGIEDVTVTIANMSGSLIRHETGMTHNFRINADGTLIIAGNASFSSEPLNRWSTMELDGGKVVVQGFVTGLTQHANHTVKFFSTAGSFTARFGGSFADLAAVNNSLGVDFIGVAEADEMRFVAFNNGDNTFTVRYELIPPPGTLILIQ